MTSGGVVPGVCTVGLGPCVALIFHLSTKISLTHTPLLPAPQALVREAQWVGPGVRLSVVKGKSYEEP